ncbi:MAG: DUF3825 domain-containing protein, partial [Bacteroidota bacterium]
MALLRERKIIPVPKYYYGSIEFTAPLYFEGKQMDIVLVIKRCDAGYYLAHTLITPDIAYKCPPARTFKKRLVSNLCIVSV